MNKDDLFMKPISIDYLNILPPEISIPVVIIALSIYFTRQIYIFSDLISTNRFNRYTKYLEMPNVTESTKTHIADTIQNIIFKDTTKIDVEKKMREEIIFLHDLSNGFLTYTNFKSAIDKLKIRKGKLHININFFDWIIALLQFSTGIYLIVFASLLSIYAYSIFTTSVFTSFSTLISSLLIYLLSFYNLYISFSLFHAYKIKSFLNNPKLQYHSIDTN